MDIPISNLTPKRLESGNNFYRFTNLLAYGLDILEALLLEYIGQSVHLSRGAEGAW